LAAGAPAGDCSDEAWSRRVGNVTPQHVGRLRRVYQRFGEVCPQYPGLYWSHFQVALDWPDAEMWLEGAVQNHWSVAQLQQERSRTLGEVQGAAPADDYAADELDEDAAPGGQPQEAICPSLAEVHDTAAVAEDGGDLPAEAADAFAERSAAETVEPAGPFEGLPLLPADFNEAFEAFKLAIIHHRHAGWEEISCRQVLAVLDALRQFALAPVVL
jgi:hypothetical protein